MAGHNKIKMTDLSELYRKLGYSDADTYIRSGNVIFTDPFNLPEADTVCQIEKAILYRLGLEIPVMIRSLPDLKRILSFNPFNQERNFDPSKMAVIFLHDKPDEILTEKVRQIEFPPNKFMISEMEIFVYCPNGFGKTKIYTNFFESTIKVRGTGRNLKTLNSILEIAEAKTLNAG